MINPLTSLVRPVSQDTLDRLTRAARGYNDDDRHIREARRWLLDHFGYDKDNETYIRTMNVLEVIIAVDRHYIGGWNRFVELMIKPA